METAFLALLVALYLGIGMVVPRYGRPQRMALLAVAVLLPLLLYLIW